MTSKIISIKNQNQNYTIIILKNLSYNQVSRVFKLVAYLLNMICSIPNCIYMNFCMNWTQFYINFWRQELQIELSLVAIKIFSDQLLAYTPFHFSFTVPLTPEWWLDGSSNPFVRIQHFLRVRQQAYLAQLVKHRLCLVCASDKNLEFVCLCFDCLLLYAVP